MTDASNQPMLSVGVATRTSDTRTALARFILRQRKGICSMRERNALAGVSTRPFMAGGRRHVQSESLKTSGSSHWRVANPRLPGLTPGALGRSKPLPVRTPMHSTSISRRSTLAALAGAATLPIACTGSEAALGRSIGPDWKALGVELSAAHKAVRAANEQFEEAANRAKPKLPDTREAVPHIDERKGRWVWVSDSSVVSTEHTANQYFDRCAEIASRLSLKWKWPAGALERFLEEGELHRAKVIAGLRERSERWLAVWSSETEAVGAVCDVAYAREDAIEETVRGLAPDCLEAIQVKLALLRRNIDLEEFGGCLLDEMLRGLAAITGIRDGGVA